MADLPPPLQVGQVLAGLGSPGGTAQEARAQSTERKENVRAQENGGPTDPNLISNSNDEASLPLRVSLAPRRGGGCASNKRGKT